MTRTRDVVTAVALSLAMTVPAAVLLAGRDRTARCPRGFLEREVRIEHQRLEAGLPGQGPVVTPNTWPEDNGGLLDRRYVVAVACVRPVTDAERHGEPYTDGGTP